MHGVCESAVGAAKAGLKEARLVAWAAGIVLAAPGADPPPKDLPRRDSLRQARRRRRTVAGGKHTWVQCGLGWTCRWCAARPRSSRGLAAAARRPCSGRPLLDALPLVLTGDHRLWLAWRDLEAPYLWCARCGAACAAGAKTWARDLRRRCLGRPSSSWGAWAVRCFRLGLRPATKERLGRNTRLSGSDVVWLLRRAQTEAAAAPGPAAAAEALGTLPPAPARPVVDLSGATILPFWAHGMPHSARARADVVDVSSDDSDAECLGETINLAGGPEDDSDVEVPWAMCVEAAVATGRHQGPAVTGSVDGQLVGAPEPRAAPPPAPPVGDAWRRLAVSRLRRPTCRPWLVVPAMDANSPLPCPAAAG